MNDRGEGVSLDEDEIRGGRSCMAVEIEFMMMSSAGTAGPGGTRPQSDGPGQSPPNPPARLDDDSDEEETTCEIHESTKDGLGSESLTEGSSEGGDGGSHSFQALLRRIQQGDQEAARELLTRFEPEVRLVVRRQLPKILRSRFDSLDFLQSVWGSFFRRIASNPEPREFKDPRHLVAFLARAAKNKVIDEYRRSASQKQDMRREESIWIDNQPRDLPGPADDPTMSVEATETFERMRAILPESKREILDLKAQGLSSKEVGDRLGVSERTVQRALETLRKKMFDEAGDPDPDSETNSTHSDTKSPAS